MISHDVYKSLVIVLFHVMTFGICFEAENKLMLCLFVCLFFQKAVMYSVKTRSCHDELPSAK